MDGTCALKRVSQRTDKFFARTEETHAHELTNFDNEMSGILSGSVQDRIHFVRHLEAALITAPCQVCQQVTEDLLSKIFEVIYEHDEDGYSPLTFIAHLSAHTNTCSSFLLRNTFSTMSTRISTLDTDQMDYLLNIIANLLCDVPHELTPEFCAFLFTLPLSRKQVPRTWEIILANNSHARSDFGSKVLTKMAIYLMSNDRNASSDGACIRTFCAMIEKCPDTALHILVTHHLEKPLIEILKTHSRALKYCLCLIRKSLSSATISAESAEFAWQFAAFDLGNCLRSLFETDNGNEVNRELTLACTAFAHVMDDFPGTLFDDLCFFQIFNASSFDVKIALIDFINLKLERASDEELEKTITPDFFEAILQLSQCGMQQAKKCVYHFTGWLLVKSHNPAYRSVLLQVIHSLGMYEQISMDVTDEDETLARLSQALTDLINQ